MLPKYKKGQELFNTSAKRDVFVEHPNMKRYLVKNNNHVSGFEDVFIGTYYCSWIEKGKLVYGDISEDSLSKPT